MKNGLIYLLLGFALVCSSACVEEQDFDQLEDLQVTPTIEASILYIESPESVINLATGISFYANTFNFDAFNETFFADKVLDGVVIYEVENTTSKELDITVEFLDEAGNALDIEQFSVSPAPTALLRTEIAYGPGGRSLDIIRNTSAIRVSATNLGDNTSVSNLPDPKIILRSSGRFRIELVQ